MSHQHHTELEHLKHLLWRDQMVDRLMGHRHRDMCIRILQLDCHYYLRMGDRDDMQQKEWLKWREGEIQLTSAVSIDNILSGAILSTSDLCPITEKPPSNASIGQLISADVSRILGIVIE